jgi:nicotinamide riboside transporter PnuC
MVFAFVVIALIGSVSNSMMRIKLSYVLWIVSNVFFVIHNFRIGEHSQAFMYAIYLVTGVTGLRNSIGDGWFSKRGCSR